MARTGFVYHPDYLKHDMGAGHPESPDRLRAILSHLEESGLLQRLTRIEPAEVQDEWITQIHDVSYLTKLKTKVPANGRVFLDPDTSMSVGSLQAAYLAAGGVLAAADAIMANAVDNAFCAVRPPGHHAERDHAMGFCLLNNVAIAARYLQRRHGLSRVLIVDWDVHHGNGTQHAFYDDPSVLFFSTHQYPCYPGTGPRSEQGEGEAKGLTINVPMLPGQGDEEYREAFERVLIPAADTFRPDFVLISAGFDAHRDDPLASMSLTEEGYADLTSLVAGLARRHCQGRILSCLEGGYHLSALSKSVERHLAALLAG
ncbi:MAG: histone deacetylase [Nitrospira sp.]|nr:histone deacetylase [Nitrospira sp.]